jgi:alpha-galactosidase
MAKNQPGWHRIFRIVSLLGAAAMAASAADTVWLDSLNLTTMQQGWGKPQTNRSVTGKPMTIGGKQFERGVGTHATGSYVVRVGGAKKFQATVGLDDDTGGRGSVQFQLLADGKKIFDSGVMNSKTPAQTVEADIRGAKVLVLKVTDAGDGGTHDHADWADARFVSQGKRPEAFVPPPEKPYLLTPKPGPSPRLNGPQIYGARPGHPFLYRIPTQGRRPMRFSADGLPAGLVLNAETGIVSGTTPGRGEYVITFHARNQSGADRRNFKLVSGDTLSLTPSMGFNDWYAYYDQVSDALMRAATDTIVRSGMADVGYQYVNIDDCWMNAEHSKDAKRNAPFRDAAGNLRPNAYFPDMKGLADYIHSHGLKAGLYTSPGPLTCAGFAGAFEHEAQDAKQFADWGYDFLKYDWCSYGHIASGGRAADPAIKHYGLGAPSLAAHQLPYRKMGALLQAQNRDILFNLCQYGMAEVWEWGAEVGGQSWRTAGDLGGELNNIFGVALKNCEHRAWQKPGAWNDPDYVQIGHLGSATGAVPCPLTPTEQYSFMSLWCLMAAPLFYSGDMSQLDEFTLNVLCNPEVIAVDQDPLGECARVIPLEGDTFLMVKNMADGSKAIGLGNRGEFETEVSASWEQLGISGRQRLRDLWRQKDLGVFKKAFKAKVPRHGVMLVSLSPAS